jgi:hypothetical protein
MELTADAGGAPGNADAGSTEQDGAHDVPATGDANSGDSDAGEPGSVADAGCTRVLLFRDRDGDGFGTSAPEDAVEGCSPMPGFVTRNGDCLDAVPTPANRADLVNPGVLTFFGVGYSTATAVESFDYNCSGREETDPVNGEFVPAPTDCEERQTCGLDIGYRAPPDPRTGPGVNALCGTRDVVICIDAVQGCGLIQIGGSQFRCH